MSKRYFELKNIVEAIEITRSCILKKIEESESDIENDLLEDEDIADEEEYIEYLNCIVNYLGSLRDEYYLWSLEHQFEDDYE